MSECSLQAITTGDCRLTGGALQLACRRFAVGAGAYAFGRFGFLWLWQYGLSVCLFVARLSCMVHRYSRACVECRVCPRLSQLSTDGCHSATARGTARRCGVLLGRGATCKTHTVIQRTYSYILNIVIRKNRTGHREYINNYTVVVPLESLEAPWRDPSRPR